MKITLYEAAAQVRDLLEHIDPETGELPEGFEQARAVVATKAQAVAAHILERETVADMIEAKGKDLIAKAKAIRKSDDWLRNYLRDHMAACGIQSIKADDGTFSAKLEAGRDKSVEVFDAAQLPMEYLREIPAKHEPDKPLIAQAIKDGFDVPGARLVAKDRLTIK